MDENINRRRRSREKAEEKRGKKGKKKDKKQKHKQKVTNLYVVWLRKLTLEFPVFISVFYNIYCLKGKR